jgi:hypothetical protein
VDVLGYGSWVVILGVAMIVPTIVVCLRFNAWLIPVVFVLDGIVALSWSPFAFIMWKLCFFYGAMKWDPVRGMFRLPKWPRTYLRGPGGRRRREFREPLPWYRGPGSF